MNTRVALAAWCLSALASWAPPMLAATPAPDADRPGGIPLYPNRQDVLDTEPDALLAEGWTLRALAGSTLLLEKPLPVPGRAGAGSTGGRVTCQLRLTASANARSTGALPPPPEMLRTRCVAIGPVTGLRVAPARDPARQVGSNELYQARAVRPAARSLPELLASGWEVSGLSAGRSDWEMGGEVPVEALALLRRRGEAPGHLLCGLQRATPGTGSGWNALCVELGAGSLPASERARAPAWAPAEWFPLALDLNGLLGQGLRVADLSPSFPVAPGKGQPPRISARMTLAHAGRQLHVLCDLSLIHGAPATTRCGGFVPRGGQLPLRAVAAAEQVQAFDSVALKGGVSARLAEGFRPALMRHSASPHGGQWLVLEREGRGQVVGRWVLDTAADLALCIQGAEILPLEAGRSSYSLREEKGSCLLVPGRSPEASPAAPRAATVHAVSNRYGQTSLGFGAFAADVLPDAGASAYELLAGGYGVVDVQLSYAEASAAMAVLANDQAVVLCRMSGGHSWCRKVEAVCGGSLAARQAALARALLRMPRHDAGTGGFTAPGSAQPWSLQVKAARLTLARHAVLSAVLPQCDFAPWLALYQQALAALPPELASLSVAGAPLGFDPKVEAQRVRAELDEEFNTDWSRTELGQVGVEVLAEDLASERVLKRLQDARALLDWLDWGKGVLAASARYDLVQRARQLKVGSADLEALQSFDRQFGQELERGGVGRALLDECGDEQGLQAPYAALRCRHFRPLLAERFARQLAQRIGARDALDPAHPLYFRKLLCRLEAQTRQGCSAAACQYDFRHVRGTAQAGRCIPE